ncbi:MAG: hypothetical protein WC091_09560 [Sulfuricellaceae bacterium]
MATIVFIGAHNDDAEIWAGGTLLKHIKNSDVVLNIVRRAGDGAREAEQAAADLISGFQTAYYTTEEELRTLLLDVIPDVLITHWDGDSHPDHRYVSRDALNSIKECRMKFKKPGIFLFCNTYNGLGYKEAFVPTEYIDISEVNEKKREVIRNFTSQKPDYWILKNELITRLFGSRCQCDHAEGFMRFSMLGSACPNDLLT